MTQVLQLKTSLFDGAGKLGVSSLLSDELIVGLRRADPHLQLQTRDFSTQPVPYVDGAWLQALFTPATDRSEEQQAKVAYSDRLIAELQAAEVLVIGAPMYNFTVPAMLKSWTDHVARAGVTFKYTDTGPIGLLRTRKVYLVMATGGIHEEGLTDHIRPLMRTMLGFMGAADIEVILAEGLNMGDGAREQGLQKARQQMQALLAGAGKEPQPRAALHQAVA